MMPTSHLSRAGVRDDVSIAIVNYNTRELLRGCLNCAVAAGAQQIVVVDNASSDGSAAMVATEYPDVLLIANQVNTGYGAAANQAFAGTATPLLLLLNSDTRVAPDALQSLAHSFAEHKNAAIIGPCLLNLDKTLQQSCYHDPTPFMLFLEESTLGRAIRHIPVLNERYLRTWSQDRSRTVPWVLGAALGVRRSAFEDIGGFDPGFFMYFEEVDLCYRVRANGWQVIFDPSIKVEHLGGASTNQVRPAMLRQLFSSTARYYRLHFDRGQFRQLQAVVTMLMTLRLARDWMRVIRRSDSVPAENARIWQAIRRDAISGWPGG